MRLTASQRELIAIGSEPVNGFQLDLVWINEHSSGLSTALQNIKRLPYRNDASAPRNITLQASRPWDAVMSLVKLAGPKTYGSGYVDTIWRTLDKLSADDTATNGRRPLTLWLEDIRMMKPIEREMIVCVTEWVSQNLRVPVRVVMLQGKIRAYDPAIFKRRLMYVNSDRLKDRARKFEFFKNELKSIASDTPLFDGEVSTNTAPEFRAVKTA